MSNENILTNGVNQKESSINGNWDILKNDTNVLLNNINNNINSVVDCENEKLMGYKNSLKTLSNKISTFLGKINNKNGIVKSNDDDYSYFLECSYFLETEKSSLSLLCNTVNILTLTKEI